MEVRIQSVVVEFILNNTEALFSPKLNAIIRESTGGSSLCTTVKGGIGKYKKTKNKMVEIVCSIS